MINSFQTQTKHLIGSELKQVRQLINTRLQCRNPELAHALQQMASHGGKFLRPTLLLLVAKAATPNEWDPATRSRLIQLGASIEILHMATLIHDDIIDDSPKRRGQISVQAQFGKDTAVYAGDLLFTQFFDLLIANLANDEYLQINARAMKKILDGELGQMALRYHQQQQVTQYLRNVNGKTAALFQLAASEGAHFAGANHQTTAYAARFGQNLGIAFQIIDDLLDYTDQSKLNKPVMQDLDTGVYSLPLLLALQHPTAVKELQPLLERPLTPASEQQIKAIVINSGALDEARQLAQRFTQKADEWLKKLPNSPAQLLLGQLMQQLMQRTV